MILALLASHATLAQKPPATSVGDAEVRIDLPKDVESLHTLHVYSNLIQMPVLVLSWTRQPLKPIAPENFSMRLDSGPPYKPTHVRLEGADPLSIAILIDLGGAVKSLEPKLADAVAGLAPQGLTSRDHISIYTMDCVLWRTLQDVPVTPAVLRDGMQGALARYQQRRKEHAPPCTEKAHLLDSIGAAMLQLKDLPGRRVIIALSDGFDRGSSHTWQELTEALQLYAVTVIGVRPPLDTQAIRVGTVDRAAQG